MNHKHDSKQAFSALCAAAAALLVASVAASQTTGEGLAEIVGHGLVGAPAPAVVVHTIDGDSIDLSSLYGKQAVYLKFWATWCVPCREQMPHFEHAYETAGSDLAVIGIDIGFNDSLDDVRSAIAEHGLRMPTVIDDGTLAAAFDLRVTPQHIIIGRDGRIAYVGHLADERLDAALHAAESPATLAARAPSALAVTERFGVGDTLPDFSVLTLAGAQFRARDPSERRPTLLVFLSPWCESYYAKSRPALTAGCRDAREHVAALAMVEHRVRWLGVASGLWATQSDLRDYEANYAPGIPLIIDESGQWFRAFDVMHVPTIVIADPDGKIVKRLEGFDASVSDALDRALAN